MSFVFHRTATDVLVQAAEVEKASCQTCEMLDKKLQNFVRTGLDDMMKKVVDKYCSESGLSALNAIVCSKAGEQLTSVVEKTLQTYLSDFKQKCSQDYICKLEENVLGFYRKDTFY